MQVQGKVAIVTGAAGGIGAAVARRLLEAGARVVVTDLDGQRLDATVAELAQVAGADAVAGCAGDAAATEHIRATVDLARERFGPVDLYVANAGVGDGAGLGAGEDLWERALSVNLRAHVRAAQLLVPEWVERGAGCFVVTASAAGLLTQVGSATYSVSKAAAVAFAEWLAVTYGPQGVQVACLCPMGVDTDMLRGGLQGADDGGRTAAAAVTSAGQVLAPLTVADDLLAAIEQGRFLVLPHAEVGEMARRKGADRDRWIRGMQRYAAGL